MFFSTASVLSLLAIGASAAVHDIQVGNTKGDNKLQFVPEAIFADVGDQVVFHFNPAVSVPLCLCAILVLTCGSAEPLCDAVELRRPLLQAGWRLQLGLHARYGQLVAGPAHVHDPSERHEADLGVLCPSQEYVAFLFDISALCADSPPSDTPNSHCGKGMIFAVNCPSPPAANSFDSFKAKALAIGAQLEAAGASASASASAGGYGGAAPSSYGGAAASSSDASTSEAASATANAGYPGTATYSAAYGEATVPPPASVATMTQTVSWNNSVYTTTYASYPGSPNPTPNPEPQVHAVSVGANGKLAFDPPRVSAQPGDIISFTFMGANHTVTQSAFADPCRRIADNSTGAPAGFDSGFQFVGNSSNFITWNVTVNDTAPTWAYCKQHATASHCGAGMVFAINSDEAGPRNFAAFAALAKQLNGTTAQDNVNSTGSGSKAGADSGAGLTSASVTVVLGAVVFAVAALF
jgi:plastocyanin